MGENSKIEWTHHTFNPWWGCVKVSSGCKNCYADTLSHRYGFDVWGKDKPRRTLSASYWQQPHKWNREAAKAGEQRRVFCASMADVFEDHPTASQERLKLWPLIQATPSLDWLLLTKRPENVSTMLPPDWLGHPMPNVWLGTSVENQEAANERIPHLLQIPAVVLFLSCEPLLGPLVIDNYLYDLPEDEDGAPYPNRISWVIVGGESGHGARPMHIDWVRHLRDQCEEESVAFFMKQWGEYTPLPSNTYPPHRVKGDPRDIHLLKDGTRFAAGAYELKTGEEYMRRVGKHAAGRLLDGRTWDELPRVEVPA